MASIIGTASLDRGVLRPAVVGRQLNALYCLVRALSGHGATSDLSPLCAPKQTLATTTGLWVHAIGLRHRACRLICPTGKSPGIVSSPSGKIFRFAVC